jgi:hypothetical protein
MFDARELLCLVSAGGVGPIVDSGNRLEGAHVVTAESKRAHREDGIDIPERLTTKECDKELERLQTELLAMQEWIQSRERGSRCWSVSCYLKAIEALREHSPAREPTTHRERPARDRRDAAQVRCHRHRRTDQRSARPEHTRAE